MSLNVKSLKNVQLKIEYILKNYPESRNNDYTLLLRFCENFYPPLSRPLYNYRDVISVMEEVIDMNYVSRCRRKAVAQDPKLGPTDNKVNKKREEHRKIFSAYAFAKDKK